MLVIPVNTEDKSIVIVILEHDNFERMANADPVTLQSNDAGGILDIQHPDNYEIVIAYEEDSSTIMGFAQRGDMQGLLAHIARGFKYVEGVDGVQIKSVDPENCRWTVHGDSDKKIYRSGCGQLLELTDDKRQSFYFCPFCGKPIIKERISCAEDTAE